MNPQPGELVLDACSAPGGKTTYMAELMKNKGKILTRDTLLDKIWGYEYIGETRTVDVHIRRLREKIESNPSEPKYIYTKWGVGYFYSQK